MTTETESAALEAVHVAMEKVKQAEVDRGRGTATVIYLCAQRVQVEVERLTNLLEQEGR